MIGRGKRGNWEKISWISVLPPRIWRDVGWTDPDVPGRDTSSFTTTRWLSHSHVLYVLTELLQLCWTVRRACCSCRATDIVRQVCLHWARQECRLWQMLAGIWECGTLAVLKLKGTWANISWNWVTADTVSPSAGCCTLFKVRDCWMNWRMERQRSRCKGHCGVHLTVLYSVLHMQISSLCYVLFHLCVTCYFICVLRVISSVLRVISSVCYVLFHLCVTCYFICVLRVISSVCYVLFPQTTFNGRCWCL